LSAQIRALEESLGAPLFARDGRKMVLNDTGRVVHRYAERIFELGDEMAEVVDRGEPAGPGTVHLGIVDGVPKPLATDIVRRAWEKVPSLRLVAREGLPGELFPALAAHQIDIVISNEAPSAQLGSILFDPLHGCETIVDGARELVFRGKPVVYCNHACACFIRQSATEGIVRVEVTDHPTATMEEYDRRQGRAPVRYRRVDPQLQWSSRSRHCDVFDLPDRDRWRLHRGDHHAEHLAPL
jgi:DNA-binding transcriptional LysR family regulator